MFDRVPDAALDQLLRNARTHNKWQSKDVPDSLLHELVELMRLGPTSANCQPARIVFVKSAAAKERLKPFLSEGNRAKTMSAPVCAIIAYDLKFYEHLPRLFPHNQSARSWFDGKADHVATTALRNSSLQGGYFILAARALGLDAGPMSGFDNAGLDKEFFPEGTVKSNFLCSLGYGDPSVLLPRLPRFAFDEMAKIL
ncbi:MAG TPA: malonic semialdehyde reductase [Hyphomicrobiaceae bacterium]|nr:malonic semialdehyde reductase [Hyphomicrobiaceae bacterium]